jgi:hypothetical protein
MWIIHPGWIINPGWIFFHWFNMHANEHMVETNEGIVQMIFCPQAKGYWDLVPLAAKGHLTMYAWEPLANVCMGAA